MSSYLMQMTHLLLILDLSIDDKILSVKGNSHISNLCALRINLEGVHMVNGEVSLYLVDSNVPSILASNYESYFMSRKARNFCLGSLIWIFNMNSSLVKVTVLSSVFTSTLKVPNAVLSTETDVYIVLDYSTLYNEEVILS